MIINKNKILFVLLAGGLSKRFGGGFKTFSKIDEKTIFETIINFLKNNNLDVVINANIKHKIFKNTNLPIINDLISNSQGPLAGIHAVMKWINKKKLKKNWIFVIPSDTPFLPKDLIEKFLYNLDSSSEILVARSNKKIHPIVAMISTNLLKSLEEEMKTDNRKILNWYKRHKLKFVDFDYVDFDPFFNINTKIDLEKARNIKSTKYHN
mgnify:CR=1 FL=1